MLFGRGVLGYCSVQLSMAMISEAEEMVDTKRIGCRFVRRGRVGDGVTKSVTDENQACDVTNP